MKVAFVYENIPYEAEINYSPAIFGNTMDGSRQEVFEIDDILERGGSVSDLTFEQLIDSSFLWIPFTRHLKTNLTAK